MRERKPLRDLFPDSIGGKIQSLRDAKKWMATNKMARLLDSIDFLADRHKAQVEHYTDGYSSSVYLTLKGLNGLKDESLVVLLNSMIHHEADHEYSEDIASMYTRVFHFRWHAPRGADGFPGAGMFSVHITANFSENSDTCRRVIVGYEAPSAEAKPIYKLECADPDQTVHVLQLNGERQ